MSIFHKIGEKLTIIGGHLSAAKTVINRVLTFDKTNQNWYNPELLSVRSRPGVVTHLNYVVVAGGIRAVSLVIVTMILKF